MSQLRDLFEKVKDESLSKEQIEKYRDELIHLHSAMQLELASIEKASAFYFMDLKRANPEESDISIKRKWKVEEKGQREIELNRFVKAIVKEIDSLRTRIYSLL